MNGLTSIKMVHFRVLVLNLISQWFTIHAVLLTPSWRIIKFYYGTTAYLSNIRQSKRWLKNCGTFDGAVLPTVV